MNGTVSFFLDGSALAKRYVPETGSALVDFILDNVPDHRIFLLNVGVAEVVSVLVRTTKSPSRLWLGHRLSSPLAI